MKLMSLYNQSTAPPKRQIHSLPLRVRVVQTPVTLYISYLVILYLISFNLLAQDIKKTETEGDTLFAMDDYKNALQKYMSVYRKDSTNDELNYHIALCRYRLKQFPDSILYFLQKADRSSIPDVQYYEAKTYHLKHKFNDAISHFMQYKEFPEERREVKNREVNRQIEISRRAAGYMNNPHKATIRNLGEHINTKYPEYVPLISADESVLYFTSRRPGSTGNKTDAYGNYYEDIYVSYNTNGSWSEPKNLGAPVNTDTHDACVALSADAQQMIIYRTSPDGMSGDLYLSQQTPKGWSRPEKFGKQINTDYKELSACFSPDGNSIIFSSDKPNGMGGKDLYRVVRLPNGAWSLASNMGAVVNTQYDEDAPYISADGNFLYFSSKGHETMGEYDIFKSYLNEDSLLNPVNLGYPVNSVGDDIFFVSSANGRHGYYSSLNEMAAEPGYESEDIYFIDMRYGEHDVIVKKGVTIYNADGSPAPAHITITDRETGKVAGIYNSNSHTGHFIMIVNPFCHYILKAECRDHETVTVEFPQLASDKKEFDPEEELKIEFKKKQ